MSTKITAVEPTGVEDQLLVTGTVGDAEVQVTVWHSHLYGDSIDPDALDDAGRYERAPDKLGGAKVEEGLPPDAVHAETNPGPRDPKVPKTDAQRRKYLVSQLEAAVPPAPDAALKKLLS